MPRSRRTVWRRRTASESTWRAATARRLLRLVNSLLDFSWSRRAACGRNTTRPKARFTTELASGFRSATERAGLDLRVDYRPTRQPAFVDREMWEKIVLNLLSNAFKYTLAGEMAVELREQGDQVQLAVRETGIGIPPEELPNLFKRFHRIEGQCGRTMERRSIGLALGQELVKVHGGTIQVSSDCELEH